MTWVAVAVAGGAVLNYFGNKSASKKQQPLINAQTDLARQQAEIAKSTQPYIVPWYQRAGASFDPAFAHYRALASGDRDAIMREVAPQLADINSRYGSIISASRNLNPRSGAGASYNADLPFRAADEGQRVINTERASAYPALSAMAGQAANIGAGAAGVATNAGEGAGKLFGSAFGLGRTAAGDQSNSNAQLAQSLFEAWKQYQKNGGNGKGLPDSGGSVSGQGGTWMPTPSTMTPGGGG